MQSGRKLCATAALAVYRRAGFVDTDLVHLTLGLADPTHTP